MRARSGNSGLGAVIGPCLNLLPAQVQLTGLKSDKLMVALLTISRVYLVGKGHSVCLIRDQFGLK